MLNQDDSVALMPLVEQVHALRSKWLYEKSPCKVKERTGTDNDNLWYIIHLFIITV